MASVPAVPLSADPSTPLGALLLQYDDLERRIGELTDQRETLNQQIKDAARRALPSAQAIELGVPGTNIGYALTYKETWRLNGKSLAAEYPLAYAQHGKKVTSWELRRVKK